MNQPGAPPEPPSDDSIYRPVSGLAIIGLFLAVVYALIVAVGSAIALASGVPLLLDPLVFLGLPLVAGALALAGRFHILRSEGTRAGMILAKGGLWISVLFGLSYLTWYQVKERVLEYDAHSFIGDWFNSLRQSNDEPMQKYVAFCDSLPVSRRDLRLDLPDIQQQLRAKPELFEPIRQNLEKRYTGAAGDQRGLFPLYLQHDLVQLIRQNGPAAQASAKGLRSWTYLGEKQGGYQVVENYEITTPEGAFEASVSVIGVQEKDLPSRTWQVVLEESALGRRKLSLFGQDVQTIRQDSRDFARDWIKKIDRGQFDEAFLDTRPPDARVAIRRAAGLRRAAQLLGMAEPSGALIAVEMLTHAEQAQALALPGFDDFAAGKMVSDANLLADEQAKPKIVAGVRQIFQPRPKGSLSSPHVADSTSHPNSPWRIEEETVVFYQPFSMPLYPNAFCEGLIEVTTTDPVVRSALSKPGAATGNLQLPAGQRPLRWQIRGITLTFGGLVGKGGS